VGKGSRISIDWMHLETSENYVQKMQHFGIEISQIFCREGSRILDPPLDYIQST